MSVRHAILALLSEGPKYGLQLQKEFESSTGEVWPLNIGQVYTTLQRLERDGLVESDEPESEGPQKGFHITDAGSTELSVLAEHATGHDLAAARRARHQGALGPPGAGGLGARRDPGPSPLSRRADAAVDAPQRG